MNDSAISSFSKLLCGHTGSSTNQVDEILTHLARNIDGIAKELMALTGPDVNDEKFSLFGTFLGRSILELSATAFIARLDPFRILILREKQTQPSYELGKPHSSSIHWQGDVLSKRVDKLWADESLKAPTRALLGDYFAHIFFTPVATQLLDEINDYSQGNWSATIQRHDARDLIARVRTNFERLYSSLSKGIHHEFVVPTAASLDRTTVKELINDVLFYVSTLALLVGFVPHVYKKMSANEMFSLYWEVERLEID